jgi:phage shock protein PspC (stress-responsive transcriptional regulator)
MHHHIINLALALAAGELVHNIIETHTAREKVEWLRLTMAGKPYKDPLPFKVDTRTKSYLFSLVGLLGTTLVFYVIFSIINPSVETAFKLIVALLIIAYVATAFLLDKYHVEIGRIINPLKKKLK